MSYAVNVLADSVSPDGVRLVTMEVTFPRFILAEVNTHRMLSRNSASSRAIPTEKQIARVMENPFVPETFNKRVKGMGVGDAFSEEEQAEARETWLYARDEAVRAATKLNEQGLDKSRANRLLEPFMWHTAIISATEWDNFFGLRDHPAAQPEFQIVARMMREALADSPSQRLDYGMWHLPLLTETELAKLCSWRKADPNETPQHKIDEAIEHWKMVSASRCARVSFDKHTDTEPIKKTIERAKILMGNGHFSPFEHVARPMEHGGTDNQYDPNYELGPARAFAGNFRGWVQMRKEIPHESRFDLAIEEQGG